MGSTGSASTPAWCHGGPTPSGRRGVVGTLRRDAPRVTVPRRHTPRRGGADDRQVAAPIGPVHPHPGLRQPGQQAPGGVPVAVAGPHRDQRDACAAGREERRIGVRAAVVRHLEDVRAQVRPGREDLRLGLGAQVAGEQEPHPALGDPDDHRQVIGLGRRYGPCRVRGEHLDPRSADPPPVPRHEDGPLPPAAPDEAVEGGHPLVGGGQRAGGDDTDLATAQRARETAHVIGVQVRHQHQREDVDPQPVQAAVDRPDVGPRIDEDAGAGSGGQDQRIALADVTRDQQRIRRWPPPDDLADGPADQDDAHERGQGQRAQPRQPPQRPRPRQQQAGEHRGAAGTGRPSRGGVRCIGSPLGHQDEPPHRPTRAPDEDVAGGRDEWSDHRRCQPEHGGRGDRRCGEEVGRQGHQADRSGEGGDQRRRRQAGCRAHGERVGEDRPASPSPQAPRPAGREQHDRRGRGHRQP